MAPKLFPEGFLWGTAISSFQAEMGRGEPASTSDWWTWVHDAVNISGGRVSGELPEDGPGFWELYPGDLRLAKEELGNNAVRLSIDWARIFPASTEAVEVDVKKNGSGNISGIVVDEEAMRGLEDLADVTAMRRYREILSEARHLRLKVMLTLFHWPLPAWLHDAVACRDDVANAGRKGWLDEATLVEFAKYAAYAGHHFGDLVDLWATVNETRIASEYAYLRGEFPPGLRDFDLFMTAYRNLSAAHGFGYEQLKRWAPSPGGGGTKVGVVAVLQYYEPENPDDPRDVAAANFNEYLWNEWSLNAVTSGDYDMDLDGVAGPGERLPHLAKGCDFIGVNHYLRQRVRHGESRLGEHLKGGDCSDIGWEIHPQGLRLVLDWVWRRYRLPVYVTENGIADASDSKRVRYLLGYLGELHRAVSEDGVPVRGYFHWTLMDSYEWNRGFRTRFGLYRVDAATKDRVPTRTVPVYREICSSNSLP